MGQGTEKKRGRAAGGEGAGGPGTGQPGAVPSGANPSGQPAYAGLLSSLNDVRAFVAVAETGSFSKAAKLLGTSQPTVSQRVQSLERLYGLRLIRRRGGHGLTDAGRELFNRARLVLSRANDLDVLARDIGSLQEGRLAVGYSTPRFAMPVLRRLMAEHPGLNLRQTMANTADLLELVRECRVDVALMAVRDEPRDMRAQLLVRQRPAFCVPVSDPRSEADSLSFSDVAGTRVVMRETGSMTRSLFEQGCQDAGVAIDPGFEVPSREGVLEAVAAGIGIGVVLELEIPEDSRWRAVPIADPCPAGAVYGVSLQETSGLPAVDAFFAACADAAAAWA